MKKVFLTVAVVIICITASLLWWGFQDMQRQLSQPLSLQSSASFKIEQGSSLKSISNTLVENGWLSHPYYLNYEARRKGLSGKIQAGEYELKPGVTAKGFLELIVSGKVIQYSLTIPEGWTFSQIVQAVRNHEFLQQTLQSEAQDYLMRQIGLEGEKLEGRFFPDTYYFPANTTDLDFLRRAYETMNLELEDEWQHRDTGLPYQSSYEALIMASIIEKETAAPEERGQIAGVFVRRLEKGMKLQTDPTVIYAMGEIFDGDIRKKDLSIDSPYNTYMYRGLPPTPIASPGRASIQAALHPEMGNTLYFVAMGDGRHYFSETLVEHHKAVSRYQLKK